MIIVILMIIVVIITITNNSRHDYLRLVVVVVMGVVVVVILVVTVVMVVVLSLLLLRTSGTSQTRAHRTASNATDRHTRTCCNTDTSTYGGPTSIHVHVVAGWSLVCDTGAHCQSREH
jgi:hypothetical protein